MDFAFGGQPFGPIPARAGEPTFNLGRESVRGAYPRSRGGTFLNLPGHGFPRGLSPLARGNQPSGAWSPGL